MPDPETQDICSDYSVENDGEDIVLKVNAKGTSFLPSIEENPQFMSCVIDKLIESDNVTKIIISQNRDYVYDYNQTKMLQDIAKLYNRIARDEDLFSYVSLSGGSNLDHVASERYARIKAIVFGGLKEDPIGTYVRLKRIVREQRILLDEINDSKLENEARKFISKIEYVLSLLEKTSMIIRASNYISGYHIGDRSIYSKLFSPSIKPDFVYSKLMSAFPKDGTEIDSYFIGEEEDTEVTIFNLPDNIQLLYHIIPPEFRLSEEHYELLDMARSILSEHKPQQSEFVDPERMRQVFYHIGRDLLKELSEYNKIKITPTQLEKLTKILVRYTVGFGLIEVLLSDEKVQDITINSPMGRSPIFLVHSDYDDCITNIIPTSSEAESWASKLRMLSGRPLDEANPILDTELILPGSKARVGVISRPLNPTGLAYAFRRHRDKPWTLPLFIKNHMINSLGAGLISFIVDGARTMIVAGTRSAGKTSLLGAIMTEIMRKYRIITVEDTLELPTDALRKLGYNIQPMKVAAALTKTTSEVSADEGIRTTLRMGDSCLIVGEVRSTEARALYEAMRVGALANVVAGTIHGDSPYGVYDRVVNDLQVPKTSFKATDIVIVANPIKSADGLHRWRRVTQISEVRKDWENDPILENGFVDLLKYNSTKDELEPTSDIINGDSDILKSIASKVKDWSGNWSAVWDNILLRSKVKQYMVDVSEKVGDDDLLEARSVILANDMFHRLSDEVKSELGILDNDEIFKRWSKWFDKTVRDRESTKRR